MTEEEKRERLERCKHDNPDLPEEMIIEALRVMDQKVAGTFDSEPFRFEDDDEIPDNQE